MTTVLGVLHLAVSLAWPLAVLLFTDRVVWFGSGALQFTGWAGAAVFLQALIAPDKRKRWAYVVLVLTVAALVGLVLYAVELISAVVTPDGPSSTLARQMAGVLW